MRLDTRAYLTWSTRAVRASFVLLALTCPVVGQAQRLTVAPDHPNGIYKAGETVKWRVRWEGDEPPATVDYVVKKGGWTQASKGSLPLTDGSAVVETKFDGPGTLLMDVNAKPAQGPARRAIAGAAAGPEMIQPSATKPEDFDRFWASKVKELAAVPPDPKLEASDSRKAGVSYWKLTLNNIRGTHVNGQIARPTEGEKLPALLIVQWAGVYGLQRSWVTDRVAEGWLVLNIEAHDLPIDQPASFYLEQFTGPLREYWAIGNDDRETSYFLRMYLSCYRAADYLTKRPDWDGKTLVVMGGSQGGQQALMTAGFHPRITAALADVPAGCDMLGPDVGRSPGWPQWYFKTGGKDEKKVREASRYFDVVNFASHIRCPVLIGAGLIDETCPPAGILAAANLIKAPKEIVLYPIGGHQDDNNSHGGYTKRCWQDWLPALRQGKPVPVAHP